MARPRLSRAPGGAAVPARRPAQGMLGAPIAAGALVALLCTLAAVGGLALAPGYGAIAALAFLAAAFLHGVLNVEAATAAVLRHWPLLLLPTWALVSVLWADYPVPALRGALQLGATVALCVALVATVPARLLLAATVLVMSLTLLSIFLSSSTVSISFTGDIVRVGMFGSKNNASLVAAETALAAIMLLALARPRSPLALCALAALLLALAALLAAKSLGTILATAACLGIAALLYSGVAAFSSATLRLSLLALALLAVALGLAWLVSSTSYAEYEAFMRSIGKDPTLTDRTRIWAVGLQSIADHPYLGVGYNSFWHTDNPLAVLVWRLAHREIGVPLGFHNLYIHTWVETGLVGALIVAGLMAALVLRIWALAVAGMTRLEAAAAALALMFVIKSAVESVGLQPLSLHSFFLCLAWVSLFHRRLRARPAPTRG